MPEGPEVYFLAYHLKKLGLNCHSYGKHLLLKVESESASASALRNSKSRDISFGLYGRVYYDAKSKKLDKIQTSPISGDDKLIDSNASLGLGPDFMEMSRECFEKFVFEKIGNSRRQLATFLLDQDEIAGLGVAWISEIFFIAGLKQEDMSGKGKDLDELKKFKLVDAMMQVQTINKLIMMEMVKDLDSETFVNQWFQNLYQIREPYLKVYRKSFARSVLIGSRQFWVS